MAVSSGVVSRPRRGTYALLPLSSDEARALAHGGPLACASAARRHGLWVLEDEMALHVWLGPGGRAHTHPDCTCIPHREHAASVRGSVVTVVQSLREMVGCLGPDAFFAALESALRQGKLKPRQRTELRRSIPPRHRWLVDFARSDADSGLESLIRLRLHLLGITVVTQVPIAGIGIADFVIGDRLILEADGRTHDGDNRHKDLVRDALTTSLGFVTLRYDYALIIHDWELVETAILAALRGDLHRSPAGRRAATSTLLLD